MLIGVERDRQRRGYTSSGDSGMEISMLGHISFLTFYLHEIILYIFQEKEHYIIRKNFALGPNLRITS